MSSRSCMSTYIHIVDAKTRFFEIFEKESFSLCLFGFTQETSGRKLNLKVDLYALPEHFQLPRENLQKQLAGDLKVFLQKMEMFRTNDLRIVDYTITMLDKADINYPYWSSPLDAGTVIEGMKRSRKVSENKANLKIMLLPSDIELETSGDGISGLAQTGNLNFKGLKILFQVQYLIHNGIRPINIICLIHNGTRPINVECQNVNFSRQKPLLLIKLND